jgi:hypothetical protein
MANLLLLAFRKVNLLCKNKAVFLLVRASHYLNQRPRLKLVVSNLLMPFPTLKMRITKVISTHAVHPNLAGRELTLRQEKPKSASADQDPNSAIALKQSLLLATKRWKLGKRIND